MRNMEHELNTTETTGRSRGEHSENENPRKRPRVQSNARQRRRGEHAEAGAGSHPAAETKTVDGSLESLDLFFRQARRHPLLTAAEEIELTKRVERGDLEAKNTMINANLRLVVSQARRYQGLGLPLED